MKMTYGSAFMSSFCTISTTQVSFIAWGRDAIIHTIDQLGGSLPVGQIQVVAEEGNHILDDGAHGFHGHRITHRGEALRGCLSDDRKATAKRENDHREDFLEFGP